MHNFICYMPSSQFHSELLLQYVMHTEGCCTAHASDACSVPCTYEATNFALIFFSLFLLCSRSATLKHSVNDLKWLNSLQKNIPACVHNYFLAVLWVTRRGGQRITSPDIQEAQHPVILFPPGPSTFRWRRLRLRFHLLHVLRQSVLGPGHCTQDCCKCIHWLFLAQDTAALDYEESQQKLESIVW